MVVLGSLPSSLLLCEGYHGRGEPRDKDFSTFQNTSFQEEITSSAWAPAIFIPYVLSLWPSA